MKRPTAERLRRRAFAYLERFATSRAHLETVLLRRALREAEAFEMDAEEVRSQVRALIAELEGLGLLDDRAFAELKAASMARAGRPRRRIVQTLTQKGVEDRLIEESLARLAEEEEGDPELAAAIRFARKRRIGPWRAGTAAPEGRQRELAKLARAGFTYEVAKQVVEATDPAELEGDDHATGG